ncbi:MAG: hypothetical protein PHV17_10125 [Candidatus Omnitrophica bacterium]|nr:hypothetical protein [Candidatus Omnitrophota bacterium]
MNIAKSLSVSYQSIVLILQLLILFLTQLLTLFILKLLKIKKIIICPIILYLGISPALVNSALSLFSEIVIYPFILAIIIISHYCWDSFNRSKKKTIGLSIISGILFFLTVLNKAIFEIIIPGFIALVFILALFTKKRKFIINSVVYTLVTTTIFYSFIFTYKLTNKTFNGNFVVTQRGDLKLYGTAVRRTETLKKEDFLTALAYVPGEGFCNSIFGKEKCSYWGFEKIDLIGFNKIAQLESKGLRAEKASETTVKLAISLALEKPFQYGIFWIMEGCKMFFWESTKTGFVSYPTLLEKLFNLNSFKNGLRLTMALLTILALLYLSIFLWKNRKKILNADNPSQINEEIILFFSLGIIFFFISAHSFFDTVTRYAFPIAPLYLIIIAFFFQKVISKNN